MAKNLFKVVVSVRNTTPLATLPSGRDAALLHSLVSTHVVLGVRDGDFISLLEPPGELQEVSMQCQNVGLWPVLVGDPGERDTMLASPIILYDYPQIAPESAGDLFDGTEIDEILSLRILTLTDEEKKEIRQSDDRARQILERTEDMPAEQFMKLHGAVRGLRPLKEEPSMNEWEWQLLEDKTAVDRLTIDGIEVKVGDRVRLRPRKGGDVLDIALAGQVAIVESIEQDYEGKNHVCVVMERRSRTRHGNASSARPPILFRCGGSRAIAAGRSAARTAVKRSHILMAGIGNIFLGDDGFGVEVVKRLTARASRQAFASSISAFAVSIWPMRCRTDTKRPSWSMLIRTARHLARYRWWNLI